jgi:hypothetical protein
MNKDEYPSPNETPSIQFPKLHEQLTERGLQWVETSNDKNCTIRVVFEDLTAA